MQLRTARRVVRRVAEDIALALVQNPDIRIAEVMEHEKTIEQIEEQLRTLKRDQQMRTRDLIRLVSY